jgi:hypothetical protein
MRVVFVNTTDLEGGAARAAYRLFEALQNHDPQHQMLVMQKSSDNAGVEAVSGKTFQSETRTHFGQTTGFLMGFHFKN